MARKSAATVEVAPTNGHAPESEAPAESVQEIRENTEELSAFLLRLKHAVSRDGALEWVTCDLPGYEGIKVAYNVDNRFEITKLFELRGIATERNRGAVSLDDTYRIWSLYIRRIENWPFHPVPLPTPVDPSTYECLLFQFETLGDWIRGEGYDRARNQRWGN